MRSPGPSPLLGVICASVVTSAQIALAGLLSFVPLGTRAQGTGASVSTALFLLAGYVLGWLHRSRAEGWKNVPWVPVTTMSLSLALVGVVGWLGGGLSVFFAAESLGSGGMARAMLATDAVLFASFVLAAAGAALGANAEPRATLFGLGGALSIVALSASYRELMRWWFIDPASISIASTFGIAGSALIVGFALSGIRRQLALVEMAIAALLTGYAIYLVVAVGPPSLVVSWSLPIEQILLALSIVPSIVLMAFLAVGGSLGFLLFGSGHFDPGFAYEFEVAKRYLQVNLKGTRQGVLSGAVFVVVLIPAIVAGLYQYQEVGLSGAFSVGFTAWSLTHILGLLLIRRPFRGSVELAILVVLSSVGAYVYQYLGWCIGAGLSALSSLRAKKQLSRRKRGPPPFVGVVTIISVLGVAIGVMALVVVLSVMSGFEDDLKSKILGAHAHVVVEKYGRDFTEYKEVEENVRSVRHVETAAAFVLGDAMMSTDIGLSGALVKGVDPSSEDAIGELRQNLERGRVEYLEQPDKIPGACGTSVLSPPRFRPPVTSTTIKVDGLQAAAPILPRRKVQPKKKCSGRTLPGVIIGKELSRQLGAYVGEVIKLVSPVSDEIGPLGPTPKLRRFRVAGIFYSGMYEYDAKLAYVSIQQAQRFFGLRGKATGVELKIQDIDLSGVVVGDIKRRLGGEPYHVKDWRDMNKELFSALLLEKIAMFVALTKIVMVASFLIVATLVMIVLQRGREIAILKSMGASASSIMKIFVIQGVIVGVGGGLLGVAAGVGICLLVAEVGLKLDEHIFYIEQLPVVLDWTEVGVIATSAVIIAYLATIYPAMEAAVLRPVEGLREE